MLILAPSFSFPFVAFRALIAAILVADQVILSVKLSLSLRVDDITHIAYSACGV